MLPCHTPTNVRVCAQRKVPVKCLTICHILYAIRKPSVAFSVFHFVLLYFFPLMNALV